MQGHKIFARHARARNMQPRYFMRIGVTATSCIASNAPARDGFDRRVNISVTSIQRDRRAVGAAPARLRMMLFDA